MLLILWMRKWHCATLRWGWLVSVWNLSLPLTAESPLRSEYWTSERGRRLRRRPPVFIKLNFNVYDFSHETEDKRCFTWYHVKTVNYRCWEVLHSDWLVWRHCHWRRSLHLDTPFCLSVCLSLNESTGAVWWHFPSAQHCYRNVTHPCCCAGALGLHHPVRPAISLLNC